MKKRVLSVSLFTMMAVLIISTGCVSAGNETATEKAINRLERSTKAQHGKRIGMSVQLWVLDAKNAIVRNWSYPEGYEGKDLEAVVELRVKKDGTLQKWSFVKRSPDPIFNKTIKWAIDRTKVVPPLPEGYPKRYEQIELTFSPKSLHSEDYREAIKAVNKLSNSERQLLLKYFQRKAGSKK